MDILLNQLHLKKSTARKGTCTWSTEKCLVKRKTASYANTVEHFLSPTFATPTPRPYPNYSKLPDFHYLPGTKTPTTGRKPDDYQPRAQIKQMFQEGTLKAGDKNAIKDFSEKYIVSEKLVADYIDHLTDIETKKR